LYDWRIIYCVTAAPCLLWAQLDCTLPTGAVLDDTLLIRWGGTGAMDALEFAATLVKSLAWPITLLIIALVMREEIKSLLRSVTNLRFKDLEVDFGKELAEASREAGEMRPDNLETKEDANAAPIRLLLEAESLAQFFPASAVELAWSTVEDELMSAIMRTASSPDYPPYNSALRNASLLESAGLINQPVTQIVKRMFRLRNIALHGDSDVVSVNEALGFISLAKWLVTHLGRVG